MLEIQRFFLYNTLANYNYFLVSPSGQALIIDPTDASLTIKYMEEQQLLPEAIWVTHEDLDHIGGVDKVAQHYNIPVYAPASFSHLLEGAQGISEQQSLKFAGKAFTAHTLKGHTPHHMVFYCDSDKLLISGDMLFNYGIGKVRHGQYNAMYESIEWLAKLDNEVTYLTAHDYDVIGLEFALSLEPEHSTLNETLSARRELTALERPLCTIGEQRCLNPYFRLEAPGIINALRERGMPTANRREVFTSIRKLRDQF